MGSGFSGHGWGDFIRYVLLPCLCQRRKAVPLVVRLAGTNVELGKKILKKSNLKIISAVNLADAAKKIVNVAK